MGYDNEGAYQSTLVFDCEAVAIDGAAEYLESAQAPANYKDEAKIAAYCEQAQREQLAKAALDIDLARIVALGVISDDAAEPVVYVATNEQDERSILAGFWSRLATPLGVPRPTLIGFNCIGYDLPLLLRRSLYLGVPAPRLSINKYRHDGIVDLMLSLSFDGAQKFRGLAFYRKRFELDVPADEMTGKDIAGLYAARNWVGIEAHCWADVLTTAALARRIGVLATVAQQQGKALVKRRGSKAVDGLGVPVDVMAYKATP